MKRLVEVEPVCPFVGFKPCIKDGWKWNTNTYHPCAYFDEDAMDDDEPCLIQRAVKKVLGIERKNPDDPVPVDVPWTTEKE